MYKKISRLLIIKTYLSKIVNLKLFSVKTPRYRLLLISIFVLIFPIVILTFSALGDYFQYKTIINGNIHLNISSMKFFLKNEINKTGVSILAEIAPEPNSNLPVFKFVVDKSSIEYLNSKLPYSGKENSVDAKMVVENINDNNFPSLSNVKLRYRGDNIFHWFFTQKSLRVELKNNDKFNLINPQFQSSILDIISYKLASEIGLLSPKSFPANVYINDKYMGVYTFLDQIDEAFLRENKKMPGSIYYGDIDEFSVLWKDPNLWVKQAARNSEEKNNRDDINLFIKAVSDYDDVNFYNFVNDYIDQNKLYSLLALDVIFGTGIRDNHHNHKWYFDPYKGKFEPILWDIRWWSGSMDVKDLSTYPLLKRIKLNPILEYKRDLFAYKLLNNSSYFRNNALFLKLKTMSKSIIADISRDKYRDTAVYTDYLDSTPQLYSVPYFIGDYEREINTYEQTINNRQQYIEDLFESSIVKIENNHDSKSQFQELIISVDGNSPVNIKFPQTSSVYRDNNLNSRFDYSDNEVKNITLYPGRKIGGDRPENYDEYMLIPSQLIYRFFINQQELNTNFVNSIEIYNAITNSLVKPVIVEKISTDHNTISVHPWIFPSNNIDENVTLSGNQNITKTRIYNEHTKVIILPGTIFYLYAGESIFFYGKVEAKGTRQKPIKFVQAVEDKPFGAVVFQGKGTSGSILEYIQIEGGSVDSRNLINYTAQLNIHDTKDITLNNCIVGENFTGDDSLHLAYVENAQINGCIFHSARSDAVDIDISQVELKNNIFINSGNDLLDFMTSEATVKDNIFINSGDKGISVGEWSNLKVDNNFFYSNLIGIEVKDKSEVELLNDNLIINPKVAPINLYNKNELYNEGGNIKGENIYIIGENKKITKDKKSKEKIDKILEEFPNIEKYQILNEFTDIDIDWSNLELNMKELIRNYPW